VDKIIRSNQLLLAAAVVFFYRLTQDQHFAPIIPVDYTLRSQLNLAFPVEFDVIYILITSFALGHNSQKCWFPGAEWL